MTLETILDTTAIPVHQVVPFDSFLPLDLSKDNTGLSRIDLNNKDSFTDYVFSQINESGKEVGVGGYGEERSLYSRSDLFEGEEPRTIHLGVDIWSKAGTRVYAPIAGKVHSFANRAIHGDYGPVIILEHTVAETTFFTLYGHLSRSSLDGLKIGQVFLAGEPIGKMGAYEENYHWPPHLHFQVIYDMDGFVGDYPGVAKSSEKSHFLKNCPDPSLFVFK